MATCTAASEPKALHWRFRVAAAATAVVAVVVVAAAVVGTCSTVCRVFSLCCPVCLSPFLFSISPPLPLRLEVESLRLHLHPRPLRPLFWLLARPCAFLWRCACWIHHRSSSTMTFSTMPCVCSTHRCLRSLVFCFLLPFPTHSFCVHPLSSSWCSSYTFTSFSCLSRT